MWRSVANWYRAWDEEQLAVLAHPERAASVAPGWRRYVAQRLAKRSPVERAQMRAFSLKYRGMRLVATLAALVLAFSLCGLLLNLATPGDSWLAAVGLTNFVGFALVIAFMSAWFDYRRLTQQRGKLAVLLVATVMLGAVLFTGMTMLHSGSATHTVSRLSRFITGVGIGGLSILVPALVVSILRNRQYEVTTARLLQEAESERMARELSETRLRLLRAQIEPHFLFNTLGAVQQLAQHGAPRAAVLTANLIDFLRSSMSEMRSEEVSLAAEFGLVESYLKVMQVRLGERLRYSVDLPAALESVKLPSMLLLTLAENAIKHGIEPAVRGGEVALSARVEGSLLRIRVADSGVGMGAMVQVKPGAGTGLDNLRHRLALAFGDAAGLALEEGEPGLVAIITLPYTTA